MSAAVPTVFFRATAPAGLLFCARVLALAISIVCIGLLTTAARLTPSSSGISTHTELGLAPCQFEVRTGLPCPTCGMTTSFAWFVRGNIVASFYVQPMGMVLALLAAMMFWAAMYMAVTGRPVHRLLRLVRFHYYLVPLFAGLIIGWAWKIYIHLHHADGWH